MSSIYAVYDMRELASSLNRLGAERNRWVEVHLLDGSRIQCSSFQVVGSLLMGITNQSNPKDDYILLSPAGVVAYSPGAPLSTPSVHPGSASI